MNAFHLFNAGLRARIYFEYVESKANVADLPSRQEFVYLLVRLASRHVPAHIPPADTWEGPLSAFISDGDASGAGYTVSARKRFLRNRSRGRRPRAPEA